jgi:hypothetical protein
MNSALIVRAEAETDLLQAAQWYEVRSDGLGTAFLQEVDRFWNPSVETPANSRSVTRNTSRVGDS